jgi:hypothetical protein
METAGVSRRRDDGYSAFDPDRDLECGNDAQSDAFKSEEASAGAEPPPDVMFCQRPVRLPVADKIGVQHHWLKTSHVEAGLGGVDGKVPGDGDSALPFSMTRINDHTGESLGPEARCVYVVGVDEACVDDKLAIGQLAGRWTPMNNCQTFVAEILEYCTVNSNEESPAPLKSNEESPVDLGAEGGRGQ